MMLLILGVLLWAVVHLFKRLAPARRAAMGEKAKGPVALLLLASIVLMVIGYRMVPHEPFFWGRHPATVGINNIAMLLAIYLFAASGMKTWITQYIRHPQLTGTKLWAVAHLLVNGDLPSFILFGGILIWAVLEVILINAQTERVKPQGPFPVGKEIGAVVGSIALFAAIAGVHYLLGVAAFG